MSDIPFDQREGFMWVDGAFINWQDAKIHIMTHGLHYGCAVFEGIKVYDSRPFKLMQHHQRFLKSGTLVGYRIPYSVDELNAVALELIARQGISNGYIRPIAWLGSETMLVSGNNCKVRTAMAVWETDKHDRSETRAVGARLNVSTWNKAPNGCLPHQSKVSGLYVIATMVKNQATSEGFDDSLFLDVHGHITEATTSNFFFIKNNQLMTPIADCFLNGITRQTIIEIAQRHDITVVEGHIRLEELQGADAAFLTGSAIEIMPVQSINYGDVECKFDVGNGLMKKLHSSYQELVYMP
ncbi:branched-chain amino acid aminotransferase [Rickettsiales endosymbiont of Peranema trichophorum]|uniref:aminotransferase class IV n=1 Tax=Rickettsiales endosymbiont of Peranema trichophorum TaxID=2486577 RepID=UPI001022B2AD|nr:aminotransferase class IV [Rickettsiales endosymbiont of Peranema trichophorum]RZI46708.1 branched-chain amino acid aminotransferase [Rickettsiales endosymbiont of Peranema trichophorum]